MLRVNSDERAGQLGLSILMDAVSSLIKEGDVKWLPDRAFARVIGVLKDANYGSLPGADTTIDMTVLHKNPKLKSGFEGVYANGQGFRAMARDFTGKIIAIGTFPTAEEAAHRRLMYYRANNLAYGELEKVMLEWRGDVAKWGVGSHESDEELIRQIKDHCRIAGTYDQVFGPGSQTIEPTFSSKLPKRDEILARARQAAVGAPVTVNPVPAPEGAEASVNEPVEASTQAIGFDPDDLPPGWG